MRVNPETYQAIAGLLAGGLAVRFLGWPNALGDFVGIAWCAGVAGLVVSYIQKGVKNGD